MRLVSVNAGTPREVRWRGRRMRSAIWKTPLAGPARVHRLHLEGDEQADPALHGGHEKAIYVYPAEHYAYWRPRLGELPWGAFGENFTTEGLLEAAVHIGDRLQIGDVLLEVTQPRTPCATFARRIDEPRWVKRFTAANRTGAYLRVVEPGWIGAGDTVDVVVRPEHGVTVADWFGAWNGGAETRGTAADLARRLHAAEDDGQLRLSDDMRRRTKRAVAR